MPASSPTCPSSTRSTPCSTTTLPLTPPEWLEWGDPLRDPEAFAAISGYSPYDNVKAQTYPAILALAGLADPRVTYWEPAKWVAKLRATMTGGGPILLRTAMGAGHAGAPGRFDRLEDVARIYAFAIAVAQGRPFGGLRPKTQAFCVAANRRSDDRLSHNATSHPSPTPDLA